MRAKRFTIVELLIAMGLMMLVVNIMSMVYARISQHSVTMMERQGIVVSGDMAISRLSADFYRARIENQGESHIGEYYRDFRLLASFAEQKYSSSSGSYTINASNFLAVRNVDQGDSAYLPQGYPYLAFTAYAPGVDKSDYFLNDNDVNRTDGYMEVVYWLVSENDLSANPGTVDEGFLRLVRASHTNIPNTDVPTEVVSYFDDEDYEYDGTYILDNVLWVKYGFGKRDNPSDYLTSYNNIDSGTNNDYTFTDKDFSSESPDYVDVLISTMPTSQGKVFTLSSDATISYWSHQVDELDTYGAGEVKGYKVLLKDSAGKNQLNFTEGGSYTFPKEGHLWVPEYNAVLYYVRDSFEDKDYLYLSKATGLDSSISVELKENETEIHVAYPTYERIFLK